MTREELVQMREYKVAQASTEYWNKNKDNDEVSIMSAFEDGVAWADEHPKNPWISVEERLPKEDKNNEGYSVKVLGMFKDGRITNCFCGIEERIWFCGMLVTDEPIAWMYISEFKKGE